MELYGEPVPLTLPRHAVSPRQVARAAEIWRLCQVAAVEASTRRGWGPRRMLDARAAFIVANQCVVHLREASYGERLWARTWVRDFRRNMITRREVRVMGEDGPVALATQQWVYVDASQKPARAPQSLVDDFPIFETTTAPQRVPPVSRAAGPEAAGAESVEVLDIWQTWMDPIGHLNHPFYVDLCEEAVARQVASGGLVPEAIQPVAEQVRFRRPVMRGDRVHVRTRLLGRTDDGAAVLRHVLDDGQGTVYAEAHTVRRMADGGDLAALWVPSS